VTPRDSMDGKTATIRMRLKFPSDAVFIEKYAPNISRAGIFIKTPDPKAVGTTVKFELQLADGTPVMRGLGVVAWNRVADQEGKPAGMGVKFAKLDPGSRAILDRILEHKRRASNGAAHVSSRFSEAPPPPPPLSAAEPAPAAPVPAPVREPTPIPPAPVAAPIPEPEPPVPAPTSVAPPAHGHRKRPAKAAGIDLSKFDSMLADLASGAKEATEAAAKRPKRTSLAPTAPRISKPAPAPEPIAIPEPEPVAAPTLEPIPEPEPAAAPILEPEIPAAEPQPAFELDNLVQSEPPCAARPEPSPISLPPADDLLVLEGKNEVVSFMPESRAADPVGRESDFDALLGDEGVDDDSILGGPEDAVLGASDDEEVLAEDELVEDEEPRPTVEVDPRDASADGSLPEEFLKALESEGESVEDLLTGGAEGVFGDEDQAAPFDDAMPEDDEEEGRKAPGDAVDALIKEITRDSLDPEPPSPLLAHDDVSDALDDIFVGVTEGARRDKPAAEPPPDTLPDDALPPGLVRPRPGALPDPIISDIPMPETTPPLGDPPKKKGFLKKIFGK
jgi:uncharacterized protein (TIGR02266 family)